jgi:hypothetical protein
VSAKRERKKSAHLPTYLPTYLQDPGSSLCSMSERSPTNSRPKAHGMSSKVAPPVP